jgi:hypothetical protein
MIKFRNKKYKSRTIYLSEFYEVLISTTSLNDALMNEAGSNYVSEEAMYIDELIYYFVEENEIDLPEDELRTLLLTEVI